MKKIGAFCEFYKEQVSYTQRLIAEGKVNDYPWDGWNETGLNTNFSQYD